MRVFFIGLQSMENLKNKEFDALIFDLDGTLWDSTATVAKAWQSAKGEFEYVKEDISAETVAGIAGMAYDAIFTHLFPYLEQERLAPFKKRCSELEIAVINEEGGNLYPGVKTLIPRLAERYKLFIVSNCQNGYIELFLKHSGLEKCFTGHACYGTKTQPKAENIRDIVRDFALKNAAYIGDTTGDANSAAQAGLPFLFVSYGFGKVEGKQIASFDSFAELTESLI